MLFYLKKIVFFIEHIGFTYENLYFHEKWLFSIKEFGISMKNVCFHHDILVSGRPNVRLMDKVRSWQWRVRQRDCYMVLGSACK